MSEVQKASEEPKTREQQYADMAAWQLSHIKDTRPNDRRLILFEKKVDRLEFFIWDLDVCATEPILGYFLDLAALGHLATCPPGAGSSTILMNQAELHANLVKADILAPQAVTP